MDRSAWILLVAERADGPLTPVQLQKALFLIGEKLESAKEDEAFYCFRPYNYGPFCAEIYTDAERLSTDGLLHMSQSARGNWREYSLTPQGRARAQQLAEQLSPEDREYLATLVRWVQKLTFNQLISSIYSQWPEYKANSIFAG